MNLEKDSVKRAKKGTGTIRQVPSGKYEYRVSYYDDLGKRKRKSFSCWSPEECIEKAETFLTRLAQLSRGMDPDSTIVDIMRSKVENDYQKNYTGEQGYDRNLKTIAIIEKGHIGDIPIAYLSKEQVNLFLSSITKYSNTMIRKIHAMIKRAFSIAYDAGLIKDNFMTTPDFRPPKSEKVDKKVRGLTVEEQQRFLDALETHKVPKGRNSYKLQLLIELYGGLRMGEINALRPENIDLRKGYIHVESTISRGIDSRPFIKRGTKTDAGNRYVPVNNRLKAVLVQALDEMRENPEDLVFYNHLKGGIIETQQVNSFYKRICQKAKIEMTGQHALRHTFATRCIEADIPAIVLKKWLGHTNIHITLDTYADVFDRMHLGAINKLDELLDQMD